jgi:hypothetical protein
MKPWRHFYATLSIQPTELQDYENLDESVVIKSLNQPLEETHLGPLLKMRTLRVSQHIRVLLTMVNYMPTYILL